MLCICDAEYQKSRVTCVRSGVFPVWIRIYSVTCLLLPFNFPILTRARSLSFSRLRNTISIFTGPSSLSMIRLLLFISSLFHWSYLSFLQHDERMTCCRWACLVYEWDTYWNKVKHIPSRGKAKKRYGRKEGPKKWNTRAFSMSFFHLPSLSVLLLRASSFSSSPTSYCRVRRGRRQKKRITSSQHHRDDRRISDGWERW